MTILATTLGVCGIACSIFVVTAGTLKNKS
jgi:hypothetical protein